MPVDSAGVRTIRVAVLADEPLGWGSGKHFFLRLLNGYEWNGRHGRFRFVVEYLHDADILEGKLTVDRVDVLVVPGGGVGDGHAIMKGFVWWPTVRRWKRRMAGYVKGGGGYVGICGGAALMTGLVTQQGKPRRFLERQYAKSGLGVSCVESYYRTFAFPLIYPFQKQHPEDIGAAGYVFSFAPGVTVDGRRVHTGGVPVDFRINTNHPLFSDAKPVERIRWWGGPALVVPDRPDRYVQVLAWYPEVDVSEDPNCGVFAWRYVGGLSGLAKAALQAFRLVKQERAPLQKVFLYSFYLAGGWERTRRLIDLDQARRPAITAEVYPNEHEGRILLCTPHPEYMTWSQGHISEKKTGDEVSIGSGFRQWDGVDPLPDLLDRHVTVTWWMVRRFVAWAAKLPSEDFPPIETPKLSDEDKQILLPYVIWDGTQANQFLII